MIKVAYAWVICNPDTSQVWFSPPASNASDAWAVAEQWEQWMQGGRDISGWKEHMKDCGWKATRAQIEFNHRATRPQQAKETNYG